MIVKLNHLQGKAAATSAQDVIGTVYTLLEEGHIEKAQFARLQIELDWIQYKQNFREVVIATHGYTEKGQQVPIMDVHVDTRQVVPGCLRAALLRALAHSNARSRRTRTGCRWKIFSPCAPVSSGSSTSCIGAV